MAKDSWHLKYNHLVTKIKRLHQESRMELTLVKRL